MIFTAVHGPQFICGGETGCLGGALGVLNPNNSQGFSKIIINDLFPLTRSTLTRQLALRPLWCSASVQCGNDISEWRSRDFCIGKERRWRRYLVALIGALAPREFLNASPGRQKLGGLLRQTPSQVLFRGRFLQLSISTMRIIGWVC